MIAVSLVAHALIVACLLVAPSDLLRRANEETLRTVMTISLGGGSPGPRAGGIATIGGRPVQPAVQTPEAKRNEPIRPPAAPAPAMTLPDPKAKSTPKGPAKSMTAETRGSIQKKGSEETPGSAVAETGARGVGFGLSTGGEGSSVGYLDVGNFCCPEYLTTMLQLIQRNWDPKQAVAGDTLMRFAIQRDGRITDVELERSSGLAALDLNAQRALLLTRQLPPIPAAFTEKALTVHLVFQYQR